MINEYINRWGLVPDGSLVVTNGGHLLPVQYNGMPAMLKVAAQEEEKLGAALMGWWRGEGAARVLAHEGAALLLERAEGGVALAELVRDGHDEEACRIICAVVSKLHAPRPEEPPQLTALSEWFRGLEASATAHGGIFAVAAATARELLTSPQDVRALHGDIHHNNILDFGRRGWLAIDPKGLVGERGFDYANLFCNTDFKTAVNPERFSCRVNVVAAAAGLDHRRLLQWILAWAGLSASWHLEDGSMPDTALAVAQMALAKF
ncbi:aminoglycoside phosphotransferase family protein [Bordetella sp. 02P26C-1]|uniref:aminoglycoside phosphotransferase family protein n=1 Tax=Bordetella sp. 02P26C-1 TaxID=2683195 RepID=UPI0013560AEE|nr:aminoglycoside phosphotransferase family protein [Bordetella sp. 02P26C-1]MVW78370.1 3'-kinase [Bordetella sp. 02P26C-1]